MRYRRRTRHANESFELGTKPDLTSYTSSSYINQIEHSNENENRLNQGILEARCPFEAMGQEGWYGESRVLAIVYRRLGMGESGCDRRGKERRLVISECVVHDACNRRDKTTDRLGDLCNST
jgi:hypothetical protein